jgi:hypothetical protein
MKVKVVIFALVLIAIVICLPNRNQAYVGPPYFDRLGHPDEHPWQDVQSPVDDDIVPQQISSGSVIVVISTKIIVIRASQIKSEMIRQTPKKIEIGNPSTEGND